MLIVGSFFQLNERNLYDVIELHAETPQDIGVGAQLKEMDE